MSNTNNIQFSSRLNDEIEKTLFAFLVCIVEDSVSLLEAERGNLAVQVHSYNMYRKKEKLRVSVQKVFLKMITASVRQLKVMVSTKSDFKRRPRKSCREITETKIHCAGEHKKADKKSRYESY